MAPKKKKTPAKRPASRKNLPEPPEHLQGLAKAEWDRVAPLLADFVAPIDLALLAIYCQAFARWQQAEKECAALGFIVKSPAGFPVQNPYLSVANKAMAELRAILKELGITPRQRKKA